MENIKPKRGRPPKKKVKEQPQRKNYSAAEKEEAKDLYLRGINLERISKYLNIPLRTLTNWQGLERWRENKEPHAMALELRAKGYTVAKIAENLRVSDKTVRRWLDAGKE